jgi:aryl-alcohol dehydrogenase-like predicted oxidoreductase
MRHRILPGTQLSVSEVCLGTMTWGEQNSEAEAHAQLITRSHKASTHRYG